MKNTLVLVVTVALATWLTPLAVSRAAETDPAPAAESTVVARVNGEEISRQELDAAVQGIMFQMAQSGRPVPPAQLAALRGDILEDMIGRELILQNAKTNSMTSLDAEIAEQIEQFQQRVGGAEQFTEQLNQAGFTVDEYKQRIRDNLILRNTMKTMVDAQVTVTDEEIAAFYEAHRQEAQQPELARASHILLRVKDDASDEEKAAVRTQIEALRAELVGGADFAKLARERSEDPGSGARGGDLGQFPRGAMVPEFDAVVFTIDLDTISEIVTTQFGYHILKVTERTPARQVPLDEVRDQIAETLKMQKGSVIAQAHVKQLRQDAKVEVLLEPEADPAPAPPADPQ